MPHKKVIIIGASSGLGRQLAWIYAESGALVGITGRRSDKLADTAARFPENLVPSCFDITAENPRQQLRQLIDRLGGLDLLVYNAGIGMPSERLDWKSEEITIRLNVTAFTEVVSFAYNFFVAQGFGQIAITTSVAGMRGNSLAPAYSASKAFMSVYAESLNLKAKKAGIPIIITDLRPGFVNTKPAAGHQRIWVAQPAKAARQMHVAIEAGKRLAYITHRWALAGLLLRIIPFSLLRRIV